MSRRNERQWIEMKPRPKPGEYFTHVEVDGVWVPVVRSHRTPRRWWHVFVPRWLHQKDVG